VSREEYGPDDSNVPRNQSLLTPIAMPTLKQSKALDITDIIKTEKKRKPGTSPGIFI
jgi:hypothetical protein